MDKLHAAYFTVAVFLITLVIIEEYLRLTGSEGERKFLIKFIIVPISMMVALTLFFGGVARLLCGLK